MPILNQRIQWQVSEDQIAHPAIALRRFGPRLPIQIGVHAAYAKVLQEKEQVVPPPASGIALIDTGATITSVDNSVAEKLELKATGSVKLGTASGPTTASTFAFSFQLQGIPNNIGITNGVGCDLGGQDLIALIGMDLLANCVFILNGPDGVFTLAL